VGLFRWFFGANLVVCISQSRFWNEASAYGCLHDCNMMSGRPRRHPYFGEVGLVLDANKRFPQTDPYKMVRTILS
jgi:hypothetical protein